MDAVRQTVLQKNHFGRLSEAGMQWRLESGVSYCRSQRRGRQGRRGDGGTGGAPPALGHIGPAESADAASPFQGNPDPENMENTFSGLT